MPDGVAFFILGRSLALYPYLKCQSQTQAQVAIT